MIAPSQKGQLMKPPTAPGPGPRWNELLLTLDGGACASAIAARQAAADVQVVTLLRDAQRFARCANGKRTRGLCCDGRKFHSGPLAKKAVIF